MDSQYFITNDAEGKTFLEYLKPFPCYGGLDLSSVRDLTSFVLAWQIRETVYVYPWFFLPAEGLDERSKADAVPYVQWLKDGYLEVNEGWTVSGKYVAERISDLSRVFNIVDVGFDPALARDVVRTIEENGVKTVEVSQAMMSLTSAAKGLESLVLSNKLVHTGHPVLRWNLDCCTIYTDVNGNIKVQKPDLKKSTKRIDGIIAAIIAISRIQKAPPVFRSIYSTRGVLSIGPDLKPKPTTATP